MSVLPNRDSFLRLIIHKIRRLLWKFLSEISPQNLVNEQIISYRDRLALLESQVNWRLYGIPAQNHNIKLEQAQLFSGSGEVEWALEKFRKNLKFFETLKTHRFRNSKDILETPVRNFRKSSDFYNFARAQQYVLKIREFGLKR